MGYLGATPELAQRFVNRRGTARWRDGSGRGGSVLVRDARTARTAVRKLTGSWKRVPGGHLWTGRLAAADDQQLGLSLKPPKWIRKAQPGKILAKVAVPVAVGAAALLVPGVAPAALAAAKAVGAGALGAGKLLASGAGGAAKLLGKGVTKTSGFLARTVTSVVAPKPAATPPITDAEQSGALTSAGVQAAQAAAASGKSSPILDALQQKAVDLVTGGSAASPTPSAPATTAAAVTPATDIPGYGGGGGGGGYAPPSTNAAQFTPDTPTSSSAGPTPTTAGNIALPIAIAAGLVLLLATGQRRKARA